MGRIKENAYKLKNGVIHQFLQDRRQTTTWLASRIDVHRTTLEKWLKGVPAYGRNIAQLARVMGKEMQEICVDELPDHVRAMAVTNGSATTAEDWDLKLPHEAMKTWTDAKRAQFTEGLRLIIAVGGKVIIVGEGKGCLKITVRLTPEQAAALVQAQEQGRLAPLGISEVRRASTGAAAQVPTLGKMTFKFWSQFAGAASIICCLFQIFPLWAAPAYIIGLVLAVAGVASAFKAKGGYSLYLLPVAGLIANAVALAMWPAAFGLYRAEDGYRFKFGSRADAPAGYQQCIGITSLKFVPDNGDRLDFLFDGELNYSWKCEKRPTDGAWGPPLLGPIVPLGSHQLTLFWNGNVIYSGQISVPRVSDTEHGNLQMGFEITSPKTVHIIGPKYQKDPPP